MRAIHFPEANVTLNKSDSMTDEQYMSVSAYTDIDTNGHQFYTTVWQPNKEDIDAINAGRPICIKTVGRSMPPLLPFTYDEQGNCND